MFNTPSAVPVTLLKLLIRPLTKIMNCDGPTAPIESGGKDPVSVGPVTPSKVVETTFGAEIVAAVVLLRPVDARGHCDTDGAFGSCGRFLRPGISNSRFK